MNDSRPSDIRKATSLCALLASVPLLPQLPWLMIMCVAGMLFISFIFRNPPGKLLIVFLLLAVIALLVLEYRGRFGRDAAACMLALMIGLKCLETQSMRDMRAILGFSLFVPFAALLTNQELLYLALSVLSIITWLFLAEACSTGALLLPRAPSVKIIKRLGMQILLAIPLAAALFWLFPRLSTPLWGLPGLSDQGRGLGDTMSPGQWLDSLADDRIAFRVSFQNRVPEANQRYWRGPVLWDFDGMQWSRSPRESTPAAFSSVAGSKDIEIQYQISLEPTEKKYLPSLDWPFEAPADHYLSKERTVYSTRPIQRVLQYSASSGVKSFPAESLDVYTRRRALDFPDGINLRTQELARRWRAEAVDDRAYIERVLNWIRADFAYTLDTDEPGMNGIDDFLFNDKKGFCQHYSSSFAILMRAAGIPARVVTGYAGGYKNPYGEYWILYHKDAHAWNEVWLENEGWVRVDPTAAVAPDNILDTVDNNFSGRSVFSPIFDYGDFIKSRWNDLITGFNAARQETLFKNIGLEQIQRWQLLVLLITISGLLSYLLFLFMNRVPKAQHEPVEAAWQNLLRRLGKIGLEKISHETALDFSARLDGKYPWSAELKNIGARYSQWRYGKPATDSVNDQSLISAMVDLSKRIRIQQKN